MIVLGLYVIDLSNRDGSRAFAFICLCDHGVSFFLEAITTFPIGLGKLEELLNEGYRCRTVTTIY